MQEHHLNVSFEVWCSRLTCPVTATPEGIFKRFPPCSSVGHCKCRVIFFLAGEHIHFFWVVVRSHKVLGSGLLFRVGRQRCISNAVLIRGLRNEMW